MLYGRFARYYDLIYSGKDYEKETRIIMDLVKRAGVKGRDLLDVGCGTGRHAVLLSEKGFKVTGIDLSPEMLKVAKRRSKKVRFLQGDMRTFDLGKEFDVIICMFSVIHYNRHLRDLEKTLRNFYRHLKTGGLLIFDMGFNEERMSWMEDGTSHVLSRSDGDVDLVRFDKIKKGAGKVEFYMGYILFKNGRFYFGKEKHVLGSFKTADVKKLTERIGFKTKLYTYDLKPWRKTSKKYVIFSCVKRS